MKVLYYAPVGLTSKQIGLTTEVLEEHIGNEVDLKVIRCRAQLRNCYFNRAHNIFACASCQSRIDAMHKMANVRSSSVVDFQRRNEDAKFQELPFFNSLEELKSFVWKNVNVGKGVASSIISHMRDYEINSSKYGLIIENELRKAIDVTEFFLDLIEDWKPDIIYLFNGRFSEVYPLLEIAQQKEIKFYSIEAGAGTNYNLFEDCLPHSIIGRTKIINKLWDNADKKKRIAKAKEFYESKKRGVETYEKSYIGLQDQASLPENFDPKKRNVAIFNSSEDEIKTIDEWVHDLYSSQNDAIARLCTSLASDDNIHIYLRVHPNLMHVDNQQVQEIKKMNFPNLTIISADSKISSYNLMDNCDITMTFGSTIGAEATYWGKISVLFGKSYYINTNCCHQPKSMEELVSIIRDETLAPLSSDLALPYAYFLTMYGEKTKHFKMETEGTVTYKNEKIKTAYLNSVKYLFQNFKDFGLWKKLYKAYFNKSISLKSIFVYKK